VFLPPVFLLVVVVFGLVGVPNCLLQGVLLPVGLLVTFPLEDTYLMVMTTWVSGN